MTYTWVVYRKVRGTGWICEIRGPDDHDIDRREGATRADALERMAEALEWRAIDLSAKALEMRRAAKETP